jgi:hypothetical protein
MSPDANDRSRATNPSLLMTGHGPQGAARGRPDRSHTLTTASGRSRANCGPSDARSDRHMAVICKCFSARVAGLV